LLDFYKGGFFANIIEKLENLTSVMFYVKGRFYFWIDN